MPTWLDRSILFSSMFFCCRQASLRRSTSSRLLSSFSSSCSSALLWSTHSSSSSNKQLSRKLLFSFDPFWWLWFHTYTSAGLCAYKKYIYIYTNRATLEQLMIYLGRVNYPHSFAFPSNSYSVGLRHCVWWLVLTEISVSIGLVKLLLNLHQTGRSQKHRTFLLYYILLLHFFADYIPIEMSYNQQPTSFRSSPLLLSLVSLCCLRLAWSCALCSLMCCRLRYNSALTCWLCMDSLANTPGSLLSTLCLPCLSTAWVFLSVRQTHTYKENITQNER